MFERFTDRGRRVIVLAQEECRLAKRVEIDTGDVLIGLIHEGDGVAAQVLKEFNVDVDSCRSYVTTRCPSAGAEPHGHIPFTPAVKTLLEQGLREALQLGHNWQGTEHLLLAALRNPDYVSVKVLVEDYNLNLSLIRSHVLEKLASYVDQTKVTKPTVVQIAAADAQAAVDWIDRMHDIVGPFADDHPMMRLRTNLIQGL